MLSRNEVKDKVYEPLNRVIHACFNSDNPSPKVEMRLAFKIFRKFTEISIKLKVTIQVMYE